jgi:UDP-glucuronate 4-epimerase
MLKDSRILLTGVTGRIGGSFAEALAPHNDLLAIARFGKKGERERWEAAGVKTAFCDMGSGDFSNVPEDFDYVIHVAANTAPATQEDGLRDNAEGTGLLMQHCRRAKAFLHVSATGIYERNPDPYHRYVEGDVLGGGLMGHYCGTKIAAEGAVRVMSRLLNLPTIICRQNVQYGNYKDGGLPGIYMRALMAGDPIRLPKDWPCIYGIVHDDDLVGFLEPCLKAARVPAETVNWGGDEPVRAEEFVDYMGELLGIKPRYQYVDGPGLPTCMPDNTKRLSITGPCKIHWRDGLRNMVEFWEPILKAAPEELAKRPASAELASQ